LLLVVVEVVDLAEPIILGLPAGPVVHLGVAADIHLQYLQPALWAQRKLLPLVLVEQVELRA
jgi:hypothetical protein